MFSKHFLQFLLCCQSMALFSLVLCEKTWKNILPDNYNIDIAPTLNEQPVLVNVSMSVLNLKPDAGASESFVVDFFYQLYWYDHRLTAPATEKVTLGSQWKDKLWTPDTYFRNSMSGGIPSVLHPSVYFTITNSTQVFMAARFQLKLSLSQTIDDVRLDWDNFRIGSHVVLPEFEIIDGAIGECVKSFQGLGVYSCLYVIIHFQRNIGNYLIKRYVPSVLIVTMTFIGFWIPTQVTPARVSLIITALLALIAQQIQGEINISYIYALEVWTIICIVFVFATLIEYAVAIAWPHMTPDPNGQQNRIDGNNRIAKRLVAFVAPDQRNNEVDKYARVVFPSCFIIAIFIYSISYYFL
ncbi:unnamed protein product [Oppiella nova]|uniref:Uncharacterized protein n=1 Tax=Oppiella nova TaxID=334625 RepID=A0A7R9M8Z5_9ACAR|nr:unnamed protein product [Oppiella nova]CAG2171877.1 unnamed protein product [Oppiella nova]